MTLPQNQISPINSPVSVADAAIGEAPVQAYIRRLHESRNAHSANDEPVRSIDPWQGIGL
jgi:hypothetical protein